LPQDQTNRNRLKEVFKALWLIVISTPIGRGVKRECGLIDLTYLSGLLRRSTISGQFPDMATRFCLLTARFQAKVWSQSARVAAGVEPMKFKAL
jgi:hypothetical protein